MKDRPLLHHFTSSLRHCYFSVKTSGKSHLSPSAVLAIAALVAPALAPAQVTDTASFPPQQIRIVVPFTAGGGTDVIARLVAKHLAEAWKVVVQSGGRRRRGWPRSG